MATYLEPITVSANDPLCTATALNGTIIGILFEKTGIELKNAIGARIVNIDTKIAIDQKMVEGLADFLRKKEDEIAELDKFCEDRHDLKKESTNPIKREIEKLHQKVFNTSIEFDRDTEKQLGTRAVEFSKGFDSLQDSLKKIDEFFQEEKWSAKALRSRGMSGASGCQGIQGPNGGIGSPHQVMFAASAPNLEDDNEERSDAILDSENKALSKLVSLKTFVANYSNKVRFILDKIKELVEEKRRLKLIFDNLINDRTYKLDLNKLSAFGFEDVQIVGG